jgi:tRNA A-37 threonylcarbamoyl transferase component Bud32
VLVKKHAGRHSEILEYRSRSRSRQVIVKRISDAIDAQTAENAVIREFNSLQTVREYLPAHLRHTVPEPLVVLPGSKQLVVQALEGKPLSRILKRDANRVLGPLRLKRMAELGRAAGQWLRAFHECTRTKSLPHRPRPFLDELDIRLAQCRANGLSEETIAIARRMVGQRSRQIEGVLLPAAAQQGDFLPQNILVDMDRIGVVDFESFSEGTFTYEDVAIFVTYVQALRSLPYYSQTALQTLIDSFLEAYGLRGNEIAFQLYLAQSILLIIRELNVNRVLFGRRRMQLLDAQLREICASFPGAECAA